jgi:hypothetical protein
MENPVNIFFKSHGTHTYVNVTSQKKRDSWQHMEVTPIGPVVLKIPVTFRGYLEYLRCFKFFLYLYYVLFLRKP